MQMSSKVMKKEEEKMFADFFIGRFNHHYNLDYITRINKDESVKDSDIDIYATAKNRETLNLQIKTGESALEHFWGFIRKWKKSIGLINNFNIEEQLADIINKAEQKYSNKEKLILLIGEKMQRVFDEGYTKLISTQHANSAFKGIYLVKLPFGSADYPYEGQIVAIKGIFRNGGKIF